jgi:5'-phosphate synthase pdxT subunit
VPKVGILALQGDIEEHAQSLAELGADAVAVRVPSDLAGVDALILPGGESTTMSLLLGSSGLFDPIADRLRDGMPAFGTCAGMILLATRVTGGRPDQRSFGAIDLTVRRNGYGRQVDSFETDLSVAGLPDGPVHAVFIRAPVVEAVGEGVEVLATLPAAIRSGAGAAAPSGRGAPADLDSGRTADQRLEKVSAAPAPVLCRCGPVLVAAFHPELSGDLRIHDLFLGGL